VPIFFAALACSVLTCARNEVREWQPSDHDNADKPLQEPATSASSAAGVPTSGSSAAGEKAGSSPTGAPVASSSPSG